MKESWELEPGDEIAPGRSVVRALGGGRRYEVFLVWDDRLFALVVAKVLRPGSAADERHLEELREEADALERLAHPVLVRGFDAVLDGQYPHVLIEHLEGGTLRQLIRRGGPGPLEQVLPLAAHVAAALHYMAQAGMVHLDVKPDNIVMGVPPRLIDLSIARTLEHAASARHPLGTETDGRDGTGQTERTQGTGKETRGDSDNGKDTGENTRGDTDGNDTMSRSGGGESAAGDDTGSVNAPAPDGDDDDAGSGDDGDDI